MTDQQKEEVRIAKVYQDMGAAISAKEKLEEAGIQVVMEDLNVGGLTPLAGIELMVLSSDLEKSLEILGE